jgi:hypothetical protein
MFSEDDTQKDVMMGVMAVVHVRETESGQGQWNDNVEFVKCIDQKIQSEHEKGTPEFRNGNWAHAILEKISREDMLQVRAFLSKNIAGTSYGGTGLKWSLMEHLIYAQLNDF